MQWKGEPRNVTLNTDLTQYGEGLVVGAKGVTIPKYACSMWGRNSCDFVAVRFEKVTLDVLISSLDFKGCDINREESYDIEAKLAEQKAEDEADPNRYDVTLSTPSGKTSETRLGLTAAEKRAFQAEHPRWFPYVTVCKKI